MCSISADVRVPDSATLTAGEHLTVATGETGYDVEFDRVLTQPGKPVVTQV